MVEITTVKNGLYHITGLSVGMKFKSKNDDGLSVGMKFKSKNDDGDSAHKMVI